VSSIPLRRDITDSPPVKGPDGDLGWWVTLKTGKTVFIKARSTGQKIRRFLGHLFTYSGLTVLVASAVLAYKGRSAIRAARSPLSPRITTINDLGYELHQRHGALIWGGMLSNISRRLALGGGAHVGVGALLKVKPTKEAYVQKNGKMVRFNSHTGTRAAVPESLRQVDIDKKEFTDVNELLAHLMSMSSLLTYCFTQLLKIKDKSALQFTIEANRNPVDQVIPAKAISPIALAQATFWDAAMNALSGHLILSLRHIDTGTDIYVNDAVKSGIWIPGNYSNSFQDAFTSAFVLSQQPSFIKEDQA